MKFLIQKINNQIRHDFAFTLIESARFHNWLNRDKITIKYFNTYEILEPDDVYPPIEFKSFHKDYVPVGSVEFVQEHLSQFFGLTTKPINIPEELFYHANRPVYNDTQEVFKDYTFGTWFVKSNEKIKGYSGIHSYASFHHIPAGYYQISEYMTIDSEWRCFVYEGKLVGLQNYAGDFTIFPDMKDVKSMIAMYKSAPISYTLDIGVGPKGTFVIEVHDFYSCGLYGFADHKVLPSMFYKWYKRYIDKK